MDALGEIATDKYFSQEYCRFRNIMGSKKFSTEQKVAAYRALFLVYINLPTDSKLASMWGAISSEFMKRLGA